MLVNLGFFNDEVGSGDDAFLFDAIYEVLAVFSHSELTALWYRHAHISFDQHEGQRNFPFRLECGVNDDPVRFEKASLPVTSLPETLFSIENL